jgi:glycosyltransferase involved in cell wall biosynthesis
MRVMVVGLRAMYGAQGGIETHVRTIVSVLGEAERFGDLEIEVMERSRFLDPDRAVPDLDRVRLTALPHPTHPALETIGHTFYCIIRAAKSRPEIVHIHGIGPGLLTPLARLCGLRVVATHHGEDYNRNKWGHFARTMLRLGEWAAARSANHCIAIAPGLAKRASERLRRRYYYIPNPAIPAPPMTETLPLRDDLAPRRYILNVARFVPEKNQLKLIEAYEKLGANGWNLVLAGGYDHESEYALAVKDAAARVPGVICTGQLGANDLAPLYANAGLFVLPSTHEGLPLVLLEAMAAGLPVLLSDIDSLKDLDLPEHSYFRAELQDGLADGLARAVNRESSPWRSVDWSEKLSEFDIDSIADQTYQVYRSCVARKDPSI